jgi:DNA polymerase-1
VASIAGTNRSGGQRLIDSFLTKFPALAELKRAVGERVRSQGFLSGLDGRVLPTRSEHAALSSLLQGFEACVMKRATWITHDVLTRAGLIHGKDFAQVGFFHDELQISCRPELGKSVGQTVVDAIELAGVELKSKCPLTGAYRIGADWAATH